MEPPDRSEGALLRRIAAVSMISCLSYRQQLNNTAAFTEIEARHIVGFTLVRPSAVHAKQRMASLPANAVRRPIKL